MSATKKVRVLIVDDSALMRQLLTAVLSVDEGIEVVGEAPDPFDAREKIKALNPDVVTLDVEMPRMNGLDFLRKIMELRPTPVVMISSLTQAGADTTLEALEIGAVDFVAKPADNSAMLQLGGELIPKIKAAAHTRMRPPRGDAAAAAGGAQVLRRRARLGRQADRHRRFDRRRRSLEGGADAVPGRRAADRDRPAHAGAFHRGLCAPARRRMPDAACTRRRTNSRSSAAMSISRPADIILKWRKRGSGPDLRAQ